MWEESDDNNISVIEKLFFPIPIVTLKPAVAKYTAQDSVSLYSMREPDVVRLDLQNSKNRV